ncbi:MAG: NAD(P)H-hydrate dehydratase [Ruminococcaceae bacterium]|nr:NAD(P)H-hydrate dehydratase [Oscillospiraceae bacterium]
MTELCTSAQVKRIDRNCGIDSRELMQNAAECLFSRIEACRDKYMFSLGAVSIVCGVGNNGGDGYALAILLFESGVNVRIVAADRPAGSDALYYFSLCTDMGIDIIYAEEEPDTALETISHSSFIVDAMFGTGLSRAPGEPYDELIEAVNSSAAFVFSVDIPSGIFADDASFHIENGQPVCIKADITSTFVMKKAAHVSHPAMEYCGDVFVEDIGIPPETLGNEHFVMFCADDDIVNKVFYPREADSNKGTYGTLVMLCGCDTMTGAACLAAQSALRCGVGLEVCAAKESVIRILQSKMNFPVFLPLDTDEYGYYTDEALDTVTSYPKSSAILIGCGLGISEGTVRAVTHVMKNARVPLVIDADALNIISENLNLLEQLAVPAVITPHPGEMARLCGCTVEYVQNNRTSLAAEFAERYGVTVVLKGNATVIASPDGRMVFNTTGGPSLAKGGMGDVLAGIIASLVAQGRDIFDSAVCGAYIHGAAGDMAKEVFSEYGVSPDDIPEFAAKVINSKVRHNLY